MNTVLISTALAVCPLLNLHYGISGFMLPARM